MTSTAEKHTVAMHFVTAAVAHLHSGARQRALAAAGIPAEVLVSPQARVPAASYSALWLAVARELDDEFFGLDRRPMKVGSFALVCQAAIACSDIDRALKRVLRGFSLFLDQVTGELRLEGPHAVIAVRNTIEHPDDRRFADETFLVLVHGLVCWLAGRRIPLTALAFAHPRPAHAKEYALMFCDSVGFDASATELRFDGKVLAAPVVQNATTLDQFLRSAPQSVFLRYRNEESWTAQIRRRLKASVAAPNDWPTLATLAAELETTATTLRRRLEAEGTSYQEVKDALRSDVAIDDLCNSSLSIEEVAARLGFNDASAFHRSSGGPVCNPASTGAGDSPQVHRACPGTATPMQHRDMVVEEMQR